MLTKNSNKTSDKWLPVYKPCRHWVTFSLPSVLLLLLLAGVNRSLRSAAFDAEEPAGKPRKEGRHRCRFCSYSSDYTTTVKKHERVHTGERPYVCPVCFKAFRQKGALDTHARTVHEGQRNYLCSTCGRAFKQRPHLWRHRRLYTNNYMGWRFLIFSPPLPACTCWLLLLIIFLNFYAFLCVMFMCLLVCAYVFMFYVMSFYVVCLYAYVFVLCYVFLCVMLMCLLVLILRLTVANHSRCDPTLAAGEPPRTYHGTGSYQCSFCSYSSEYTQNVKKHERIHTGERPYVCGTCSKTFAEKSSLNRHSKTVHRDQRSFVCLICGSGFKREQHLQRHKRVHFK
ncbi:zinc finger protein 585A-like [Ornithodoros turicata]|uniref:zinc finger protein 585A-like n=1 Tax=Ornithodoros turicata TaxID=34597 RepID=UPI0031391505